MQRAALLLCLTFLAPIPAALAQTPAARLAERTAGLQRSDGFVPFYWDEARGRVLMEVPAFGEESVPGWLGLTHLGSHSVVIDTPDYSGSPSGSPEGCIKRQGSVQSADPVFGTAKVTVFVVVPGCLGLPPPAPVPTPAAAPSPPVQNPNYDPGGM